MSALGAFNTQLIRFFEQLSETYPEERDIKLALQAIMGAKLINPKLILDLFYEHVCRDLKSAIVNEESQTMIQYAKHKISTQFNEIWSELKRYVNTVDRAEAAETVVSVLIDNDVSADDIKTTFKTDSEIKRALTSYLKDHEDEIDEDEDDEFEEDEDY